ncbi:MAG: glycerol-3-phosphate acyltransferase [Actinobacteria bacterium]|nr:glycerol-3-phosphate acyltransferase [Actinomycetota bacterium]
MLYVKIISFLIAAYLIGAIPNVYIWVRVITRKDISTIGSKNVGGMNAFRNANKIAGSIGGILDILKGTLVTWASQVLFHNIYITLSAAFLAIVGHNWSIFIKFKGGKGVGTTLGVMSIIEPVLIIPFLIGIVAGLLILKDGLVGTVIGFWLIPISSLAYNFSMITLIFYIAVALIGTYRFRDDLKRFMEKQRLAN